MTRRKITKNNTAVIVTGSRISVALHSTLVVEADADWITLDTGGFDTVTTIRRMNEAASEYALPYKVFKRKGVMLALCSLTGETMKFEGNTLRLPRRIDALKAEA